MPTTIDVATRKFTQLGIFGGATFFAINGLVQPFFVLYATSLGASTFDVGLLVMLKAFLPIFIAMPTGQLIDSIGPMKMLNLGSGFLLCSVVCTILAGDLLVLALSQVLVGAAILIMASSFQVLISQGDTQSRNLAIKRYSMWMSIGAMLGPIVGGIVASTSRVPTDGYRAAFIAALLACIAFMAVLFWMSRSYPHPSHTMGWRQAFSVREILGSHRRGLSLAGSRPVQFGLIATFLIMFIEALYMGFMPLYLAQNGFSTILISVTVATHALMATLSRFGLNWLTRRLSLEVILLSAGMVAALGVLLTPLAVASPVTMLILVGVIGAAMGFNLPVSIMIMVDAVQEADRGKLMGLRLLSNRISQVVSPVLFGGLAQFFGLTVAFYGGGAVLIAALLAFSVHTSGTGLPPRSGS